MIRVISIGTDRNVFEKGSAVRERLLKQRDFFSELHVIVFTPRHSNYTVEHIGNLWLYPTNSWTKWLYPHDAASLAKVLVHQREMVLRGSVITVQDPFECGLAGLTVHKATGLPLHVQVHTDFLNPLFRKLSLLNRIRILIARRVLLQASRVRVVSARIMDTLVNVFPMLAGRITVLPVWTAKKSLSRHEGSSGRLAIMLSRFAPEKDIGVALDAVSRTVLNGDAIGLTLVGEGKEKDSIARAITQKNIGEYVHIEGWRHDTTSILSLADMALSTSHFEGFGISLLEYATAGIPIIATDAGIATELIPEAYKRFICPIGDSQCFSDRMKELAHDPLLRASYGSALKLSAKKFQIPEKDYWDRYRDDIERCIEQ